MSTFPVSHLQSQLQSILDVLDGLRSHTQWLPQEAASPIPFFHTHTTPDGSTLHWISTDITHWDSETSQSAQEMHNSIHQSVISLRLSLE
ncbi:MAG: hypothetical protein U0176_21580 [Bacteroidia bacterium]